MNKSFVSECVLHTAVQRKYNQVFEVIDELQSSSMLHKVWVVDSCQDSALEFIDVLAAESQNPKHILVNWSKCWVSHDVFGGICSPYHFGFTFEVLHKKCELVFLRDNWWYRSLPSSDLLDVSERVSVHFAVIVRRIGNSFQNVFVESSIGVYWLASQYLSSNFMAYVLS